MTIGPFPHNTMTCSTTLGRRSRAGRPRAERSRTWSSRALAPVETFVAGDMATAVAQAIADSQPGDTVLLAPAAASFDQYDNFERRGEDFEAQVKRVLSRA